MVPTKNIGAVLYIPPDGLLQVFQDHVDPVGLLNGPGKYVCVHVGTKVHVHFRAEDDGTPNPRATVVLAKLTEVHMGFTGTVVFDGLDGRQIVEIIQELNRKEDG